MCYPFCLTLDIKKIFTITHYCAAEEDVGILLHIACDKVKMRRNGIYIIVHVMYESLNNIKFLLEIKNGVKIQCPWYE